MSYYPPPNQGQEYSVSYYPSPHQGQPYGNEPPGQYNRPGPFPTDQYGPPGSYPPPGQYPPPVQYPLPGQYPPPEQYPPPGQPYAPEYGQPEYGGGPIVNQPMQPMGGDWMSIPQGIPNCPPGLEYLISLSNLFVKQKVEFLEALTGFETKNKYTIKNDRGEKMYWAVEESDMCTRLCCGRLRPFEMSVMDAQKREIIRLNRPLNCAACCFPCCLQKMEVFSPPGNLLGTIEENWTLLFPEFSIKDAAGVTVLKIEGPFCGLAMCGRAEFQVLSRDGQVKVGKISKEWGGLARELFTDADYFGISFPQDLDVRMKAVMIGAVFLIVRNVTVLARTRCISKSLINGFGNYGYEVHVSLSGMTEIEEINRLDFPREKRRLLIIYGFELNTVYSERLPISQADVNGLPDFFCKTALGRLFH